MMQQELDYNFARRAGSNSEFERVVYSEGPTDELGRVGAPDMFKLEFSGWVRHVEFKEMEK